MDKISTPMSRKTIITLIVSGLLCWVFYTGVTLHNYAIGVVSDMRQDLRDYFEANERIARDLESILPSLATSSERNANLNMSTNKEAGVNGFNINHYEYTEYAGTMVLQGELTNVDYDVTTLFHRLDVLWAKEDGNVPRAFFVYYDGDDETGTQSQFLYTKLRYAIEKKPPFISPDRYRVGYKNMDERYTFMSKLSDNYPTNDSVVVVISPVELEGELVGDVGIELNLQQLMLSSLGPWMNQYLSIEISSTLNPFVRRTGGDLFLPNLFTSSLSFRHMEVTAYIKVDYVTKYVLPWFASMLLFMLFVYFVITKQRNVALKFSSLSKTDELTGLYNKRVLKELSHFGIESGSLFYIDINEFKLVNDTYGHHVGDLALKHVADKMPLCIRSSDLCLRLGGDEFLLITKGVVKSPQQVIESLLKEISQVPFYEDLTIKIAIGYSEFKDESELSTATKRADQNMYKNKNESK